MRETVPAARRLFLVSLIYLPLLWVLLLADSAEHRGLLIVFSDGVSEALSAEDEEYGEGRIVDVVRKQGSVQPQEMLDALFGDVRSFARGAAQSDDITALVLRYTG